MLAKAYLNPATFSRSYPTYLKLGEESEVVPKAREILEVVP